MRFTRRNTDPKKKTKKTTTAKKPTEAESLKKDYKAKSVRPIKNSKSYTMRFKRGSVTVRRGKKVKNPGVSIAEAIRIASKKD